MAIKCDPPDAEWLWKTGITIASKVASNKNVPVPIELNRGIIIEIKIESRSWTNRYWPSGTWVKNERKIFVCSTSEILEFRIFAKVKTIKAILENIQIKLEIAASFLNSKFVWATFPFMSSVKKVIARRAPTSKKLEVIEVNLKTVSNPLISD
jgi:hypothetical protein